MIKIEQIEYHRNGVCGAPFSIVTFTDTDAGDTKKRKGRKMVGIVFGEAAHVAVLDRELLGKGNITFGENSWRGETYEKKLRAAIAEEEAKDD